MAKVSTHSPAGVRRLVETTTALVRSLTPAPVEGTHGDLILHAPETLRGHREHIEHLARQAGCYPLAVSPLWDEEFRVLTEARADAAQRASATGRTLIVHPDWDQEMGNVCHVIRR